MDMMRFIKRIRDNECGAALNSTVIAIITAATVATILSVAGFVGLRGGNLLTRLGG